MQPPDASAISIPPNLDAEYRSWSRAAVRTTPGHGTVYRLEHPGGDVRFLKVKPAGVYPGVLEEAERLRWAAGHLPVPEVVSVGGETDVGWLVTTALPGVHGADPRSLARPSTFVATFAAGLRHFHDEAPVDACPFDSRLDVAVARAHRRLTSGAGQRKLDFHDEHRHLTPDAALDILQSDRPPEEDLVVCHGDYCPPNVLLVENRVTGYLDLGELGVADRWWDLAVATWSLDWNLGPGHQEAFLALYGAPLDPDRLRYYRLLYDAVS